MLYAVILHCACYVAGCFLRLDESAKVVQALESIGLHIHLIDGERAGLGGADLGCSSDLLAGCAFVP
jgi:hypothetical protein